MKSTPSSQVHIQFQGFHPSPFTHAFLDDLLADLQRFVPRGASLRAICKRRGKVFVASVQVGDGHSRLFASSQSQHLREVGHQLKMRLRKQLQRARRKEFAHDAHVA